MTDTTEITDIAAAAKPEVETIIEQAEGLFEQAREALSDAFDATVDAVKEHPYAAAGIAAGAAAAVAGAAFGASKLLASDEKPAAKGAKKS